MDFMMAGQAQQDEVTRFVNENDTVGDAVVNLHVPSGSTTDSTSSFVTCNYVTPQSLAHVFALYASALVLRVIRTAPVFGHPEASMFGTAVLVSDASVTRHYHRNLAAPFAWLGNAGFVIGAGLTRWSTFVFRPSVLLRLLMKGSCLSSTLFGGQTGHLQMSRLARIAVRDTCLIQPLHYGASGDSKFQAHLQDRQFVLPVHLVQNFRDWLSVGLLNVCSFFQSLLRRPTHAGLLSDAQNPAYLTRRNLLRVAAVRPDTQDSMSNKRRRPTTLSIHTLARWVVYVNGLSNCGCGLQPSE